MARVTSTPAQLAGDEAEGVVARRLEAMGWMILGRNVRLGRDELDLVAVDPDPPRSLVILEVRRRGRRDFGLAEETLDRRKRRALRRAIATLLDRGTLADGTSLPALPWRVDLVAIDLGPDGRPSIRHHRGIHP
jgi:Holliday junction resolvase-like predicted endonuclease